MKCDESSTLLLKRILCIQKRTNIFYDIAERIKDNDKTIDTSLCCGLHVLIYRYREQYPKSIAQTLKKRYYLKKFKDAFNYRDNIFFTEKIKTQLEHLVGRVQKLYMALNRFAFIWKLKHTDVISYTDLYFNELEPHKSHVIQIYQNKKLFYFTAKDFMMIIQHALCACNLHFDIESTLPCNPYNKVKFTTCHLYNVYYQMRYKMRITISEIMEQWFRLGFCFHKMHNYYYPLLQKYAIKMFVWSAESTRQNYVSHIHNMFEEFSSTKRKIHIHRDFPKDILVEKTRDYMYLFYLLKFASLDDGTYDYYERLLTNSIRIFENTHRSFGRLMYKTKLNKPTFPTSSFELKPNILENDDVHEPEVHEPEKRLEYIFCTDAPSFQSKHL